MLIVLGGLPGTGKTTVARALAAQCGAFVLRIDAIEQAMRDAGITDDVMGAAGYDVAAALAQANLGLGATVIIDAVNPVAESRAAWRNIAAAACVRLVEIECVCSDAAVHRARLEARPCDIAGLAPVAWQDVVARHYETWREPHAVIDTADLTVDELIKVATQTIETA